MWKKTSSTSNAGKSAYLCVENETQFPSLTVEKPIKSESNDLLYELKRSAPRKILYRGISKDVFEK